MNHVLKVAQQTRLAGAPTINGLLGITHHQQTAHAVGVVGGGNFLRQWSQRLPLANAGVLKLVKQQVVNARVKSKGDFRHIGVVHGARQLASDGFKGDLLILGHDALPRVVNQQKKFRPRLRLRGNRYVLQSSDVVKQNLNLSGATRGNGLAGIHGIARVFQDARLRACFFP